MPYETSGASSLVSRAELWRKLIHMAVGLGAFAVVFLGPLVSALAVLTLVLFNLFVLPRLGGRILWREGESRRGIAVGIVLYPSILLVLFLVFWRRIEIPAATWGILAFGDGMAAITGKAWGRVRLPWNPAKSWAGTLAFWLFGTLGSTAVLAWTLGHQGRGVRPEFLLIASSLVVLLAAFVESLPQRLDDNLTVPLWSSVLLWGALEAEGGWALADFGRRLVMIGIGLVIIVGLALVAYLMRPRRGLR